MIRTAGPARSQRWKASAGRARGYAARLRARLGARPLLPGRRPGFDLVRLRRRHESRLHLALHTRLRINLGGIRLHLHRPDRVRGMDTGSPPSPSIPPARTNTLLRERAVIHSHTVTREVGFPGRRPEPRPGGPAPAPPSAPAPRLGVAPTGPDPVARSVFAASPSPTGTPPMRRPVRATRPSVRAPSARPNPPLLTTRPAALARPATPVRARPRAPAPARPTVPRVPVPKAVADTVIAPPVTRPAARPAGPASATPVRVVMPVVRGTRTARARGSESRPPAFSPRPRPLPSPPSPEPATEKPSVEQIEKTLRESMTVTVERTVRREIERTLRPDARLTRRLRERIQSDLYHDVILERERLGGG